MWPPGEITQERELKIMRKLERHHTIIDSLEGFLGMLLPRDGQAAFRQQRSCLDQISIPQMTWHY